MALVSIITPVHNSEGTVSEALRSMQSQTLDDWEALVIDDGSIDGTVDVVKAFQDTDPRIELLTNIRGRGAAGARNTGIDAATGRYIAFLDSDDLWDAEKLAAQIGFMEAESVLFSFGNYRIRNDATGGIEFEHRTPMRLCYEDLLRACPIGCLTAAYNQEILGKHYMPNVKRGQDWGLWLALTRDGQEARRYPGCHAIYRKGDHSLSSAKLRKILDMYRIYVREERLKAPAAAKYTAIHAFHAITKWKARLCSDSDGAEA